MKHFILFLIFSSLLFSSASSNEKCLAPLSLDTVNEMQKTVIEKLRLIETKLLETEYENVNKFFSDITFIDSGNFVYVFQIKGFPDLVFKIFKSQFKDNSFFEKNDVKPQIPAFKILDDTPPPKGTNFYLDEKARMKEIEEYAKNAGLLDYITINGFKLTQVPGSAPYTYMSGFIIQQKAQLRDTSYIDVEQIIKTYNSHNIIIKDPKPANTGLINGLPVNIDFSRVWLKQNIPTVGILKSILHFFKLSA